jgi:hypothetical protein
VLRVLGVLCGVGLLAFGVGGARAGDLSMVVTESGGPSIPIADNGAFDSNPDIGVINVNTSILNLFLVNSAFTSLGASSNSPGFAHGLLLVNGGVKAVSSSVPASVSIQVTDINYVLPAGTSGVLSSSTSDTFINAPNGNTQKFTSWFNSSDGMFGMEHSSPVLTLTSASPPDPNSHSADAASTPVSLVAPYSLTNEVDITLSGGSLGDEAQVQFSGVTSIAAGAVPAIPEPATLTMLGVTGVYLCGWRWLKRKRPRVAA